MPRSAALALVLVLAAAGCGGGRDDSTVTGPPAAGATQGAAAGSPAGAAKPDVRVPDGPPPTSLQVTDLVPGTGTTATPGSHLTVNYVGVSYSTKQEFDASYGATPFDFDLGAGMVIGGWDQGLVGMKVGGRRQLVIPPDLGYGAEGQGPIAPNETLVFVIDLLRVN